MKLDARMFALVGFLSVIASTDDSLASLPSTRRPLVRPECDNTPLPDPASAVQTMAVHEAIANYLLDPRAKPRFTCRSQRMQYIGTRAEDEIHVISTYIASNQRHADYVISKSKDSGWGPHGVMKSWWRNGKPQSSEYFCGGWPTGFHRYYDEQGTLATVVDYTKGDYDRSKPSDDLHSFHGELGRLGSIPDSLADAQRFRQVFAVNGGERRQTALFVAPIAGRWAAVDPSMTVEDWTTPGPTTSIALNGNRWQLVNIDWSYVSFAEVYQRHRSGTLGVPPRWPTRELLECPWLDEAMEPGLTDARLRFAAVSGAAESPDVRARRCLATPSVECLLRTHYVANRSKAHLTPLIRMAVVLESPALAREAADYVFANLRSYSLPNPIFAEMLAWRAMAEKQLGLATESAKSFEQARVWSISNIDGTPSKGQNPVVAAKVGEILAGVGHLDAARDGFRVAAGGKWGDPSAARRAIAAQIAAFEGLPKAQAFLASTASSSITDVENDLMHAAIARYSLGAGDLALAKQAIEQVRVGAERVRLLGETPLDAALFAGLWQDAVQNFDTLFVAADDLMKRRLMHAFLAAPAADRALRARLRERLTTVGDPALRTRAACELAAAFTKAGDLDAARTLWPVNATAAVNRVKASGACAFWARHAGDTERGKRYLDEAFENLRTWQEKPNFPGYIVTAYAFAELAIVQYESDHGELSNLDFEFVK
jgi:hypothetical protein